jgi:sugar lactone lactonase YvrE
LIALHFQLRSIRNPNLHTPARKRFMLSASPRLIDVTFIGSGLVRPECVLATETGDLFTGDWRGGIAHVKPDGSHVLYQGKTADIPEGLRPNGIALESDGAFLFANLGTDVGGVWRIDRGSAQRPCQVRPVLAELEGKPLPPSNFVTRDAAGRMWLTVSTRVKPRGDDFSPNAKTGFIVLQDGRGARIVADELGYTNECFVHPSGDSLYVIETYARRLSRFVLKKNGDLGPKEIVADLGSASGVEGYPDGFAFDAEGGCWVACVVSNQLLHVARDGRVEVVLEDKDAGFVAATERAFLGNARLRPAIDDIPTKTFRNISNVAFGGADLKTLYLGCLSGDRIAQVKCPVAGHPPVHWRYQTAAG